MDQTTTFQNWIDKGYELFSRSGPDGVRVQTLARKLGVSKSSFYHYFGDQESFIELLLEEHAHIAEQYTVEVKRCKVLDPDFIDVVMKYKSSILFQQQLRNHSENPDFERVYRQITDSIATAVLDVWAKYMGISSDMSAARSLYLIIVDVFYERLNQKRFTHQWIHNLLEEIVNICKRVVEAKSSVKPSSGIGR